MINKENQRRKIEDSQKESIRQTKKETEEYKEKVRGYGKKRGREEQKVEDSSIQEKKDTEKNRISKDLNKEVHVSFRKHITTKKRRKKTMELRSA